MAKNQSRRVPPETLAEDERAYAAIKAIKDYAPANPAYSLEALEEVYNEMKEAQEKEAQARAAAEAARDSVVLAQWEYHNALLSAGDQVAAQYGKDSDQWQALGKKKKSEFKVPTRAARGDGEPEQDGH